MYHVLFFIIMLDKLSLLFLQCDLVSALMKWLDSKQALEDGMTVTGSIVKLMVVLTTHQEVQMSVCKASIRYFYNLVW